uniref:Uncharacterized protein n=1 Tax=viral metagenome TaxID=1070528 RepID=A0A6M3XD78_9ZZZZ
MNKISLLALIGTGLSLLMLLHSLWQLDLICVQPVWSEYWSSPPGGLFKQPFQCGFWFRTTVGNAYDLYLGMAVVSWFVLLVSLFGLFYNERKKVKKLEKKLRSQQYANS